ncbi:unnamed protein product [Rhodiola kirilowii]
MQAEIDALQLNETWEITDLPSGKNAVGCKWVYKIKRHSDDSIERYKAMLVAKSYTQEEGLDYHETFAHVVKMTTIRTVLSLASTRKWPLYQLDVSIAFLHDTLDEEVYIVLPPGHMKHPKSQGKVCRLKKNLYGLKQASRQWFSKFSDARISFGFKQSLHDYSLFTYEVGDIFLILLVHVDDVVIIGTCSKMIEEVKKFIHDAFKIKDLRLLKFFLGIEVARSYSGVFINQRKYVLDLLNDAGLLGCKPSTIPMDTKHKLSLSTSELLSDPTSYKRLVGKLIYLTVTRPDLTYPVHILSQFISSPKQDHLNTAHKVLRFIKQAPAQGLFFASSSTL